MFKGLRTKIESEQRGQTSNAKIKQAVPQRVALGADTQGKPSTRTSSIADRNESPTAGRASNPPIPHGETNLAMTGSKSDFLGDSIKSTKDLRAAGSLLSTSDFRIVPEDDEPDNQDVDCLRGQLSKLKEQMSAVMRERDESNNQNAQLYESIEKLRQNLEVEQEIKSSLQSRLNELEEQLKKKTDSGTYKSSVNRMGDVAFNKSSNPDTPVSESNIPNDLEALRNEMIQLQAQLVKKNRQLKIRQQNLTDIKRTLQKEILDHSRTQEELSKLQKQLQAFNQQIAENQNHSGKERSMSTTQNGSSQGEIVDTNPKILNQSSSDKNQEPGILTGSQSGTMSSVCEDTVSLNVALGLSGNGDRLSCPSRSSASVEDFESHDPQQSNYNKEVSQEYLRNVLYRYMTSTDNETTQHLVKAISVLMDFSPEQSAAIKSAMNTRFSWLRLK